MRRKLFVTAAAMICGAVLASCGGGSNAGSGSKIKKNEYLGNIPALYESYYTEIDALEKKVDAEGEKLMAGGEKNYGKVQKLFDDQKVKEKAMKEKFQADVKTEMEKIVGKDIPVSYSEQLRNSDMWYYDATAKIGERRGEPILSITLTAKNEFTVPSMKAYDYNAYFRLVGKDGTPLKTSPSTIIPIKLEQQAQSFSKGDVLIDSYEGYGLSLSNYATEFANFAGIEFITKEEYNQTK